MFLNRTLHSMATYGIMVQTKRQSTSTAHRLLSMGYVLFWGIFLLSEFLEFGLLLINGNNISAIDNIQITLCFFLGLLKVMTCRSERVQKLVSEMCEYDKEVSKDPDETVKKAYSRHVDFYQKLCTFLNTVGYSVYFSYITFPFLVPYLDEKVLGVEHQEGGFDLPVSSWFPFDISRYFYYCYVFQIVGCAATASGIVLTDALIMGVISAATMRMEVLCIKLRKIINSDSKDLDSCIREHQFIIRFVKEIDTALKPLMMMDFLICSVQVPFIAFNVMVSYKGFRESTGIIYLLSMLIQMFLFYWIADRMTTQGNIITTAAWESKWYYFDQKDKKSLAIMMCISQRPLELHAGPFYRMSNETTISILKNIYSFLMLMYQMFSEAD